MSTSLQKTQTKTASILRDCNCGGILNPVMAQVFLTSAFTIYREISAVSKCAKSGRIFMLYMTMDHLFPIHE